jgi:hypothetical protein
MLARTFPLFLILATITLASPSVTIARSFWTDANGDGLPDQGGPGTLISVGDTVAVDLWIDSEDLVWDQCWLYVGWPQTCFDWIDADFYITGGFNLFELSWDDTLGFIGFDYSESGVDRIGWVKLRCDEAAQCCIEPILSNGPPGALRSELVAQSVRYEFDSRDISCFGSDVPNAVQSRSWGQVKALYR